MTDFQITILIAGLLCSVASTLFAALAFVRAGKWRETDDGKKVNEDIHTIKNEETKIGQRLNQVERSVAGLPQMGERLTAVESRLESVASAGDFRELKAELEGLEAIVRNTHAATQRIEGWLMEGRGG